MWLVTEHGFFNIVQSDGDEHDQLLTVKARRKDDLAIFADRIPSAKIEESDTADYRFRLKGPRELVSMVVNDMVEEIDYPRFKGRIAVVQRDRLPLYTAVWETLYHLQEVNP